MLINRIFLLFHFFDIVRNNIFRQYIFFRHYYELYYYYKIYMSTMYKANIIITIIY